MTANVAPIFTVVADIQWIASVSAANTNANITAGTSYLAFQADPTNGGFVRELRVKYAPGASTVATVMRVWINNGSDITDATTSILISEFTIPATTTSATAAQADLIYPLNFPLPPSYRIYVTLGTATGAGSLMACVIGGKY